MHGLAEYALKGRRQTILVVVLCGLLPLFYFLSAAIVALVNLRKGWQEGFIAFMWALLPTFMWIYLGNFTPIIIVLATLVLATVLRESESWQVTLLVAMGIGFVSGLSLHLQPELLASIVQATEQMLASMQLPEGKLPGGEVFPYPFSDLVLSGYGTLHMLSSVICLMLARWLQATQVNPGGFQQEFHQLRLDRRIAASLMAVLLGSLLISPALEVWTALFTLPLILAAIALVHATVAARKLNIQWLLIFYIAFLLLFPLMLQVLLVLAVLDSWFDFRKRLQDQR